MRSSSIFEFESNPSVVVGYSLALPRIALA
jgi:hypothetical protein